MSRSNEALNKELDKLPVEVGWGLRWAPRDQTEAFSHLRRENETQVYLPKATWDTRATTVGWKLRQERDLTFWYGRRHKLGKKRSSVTHYQLLFLIRVSTTVVPLLLCLELPCIILSTGSPTSKCGKTLSFPYIAALHSAGLRVFLLVLSPSSARFCKTCDLFFR